MSSTTRYDTASIAERERFDFWQEAVCDSFVRLGCETERRDDFQGRIEIARHSVLAISTVRGMAHRVRRRRRDIGRATEASFLLSLQIAGSTRVSQFGQNARLEVGDMAIYSSTDRYELELSDDFAEIVVQVPRERLLARLPNADAMTARRIDGRAGIGQLVRDGILGFAEHADAADPVVQSLVQETLIDLIATGIASRCACAVDLSSPERHVLLRVRHFVREHLADPALCRQSIAAEIGLSVRRLNAVLAKEDTSLSELVRHARLARIAEELVDPRCAGQTIGEIAFRYGFQNLQHFSKAFRAHHGTTPRDHRASRGSRGV